MGYIHFFLSIFIYLCSSLNASENSLHKEIATLLQQLSIPETNLAYAVIDLNTGKPIDTYNEESLAPPASTLKILSQYYALAILGPDYQFKTSLGYSGKIHNGTLEGNLILKGGGDPSLTAPRMIALVDSLKRLGIKKITGKFIYDQSELPFTQRLSEIGLEDQPDNPALGALNFEFNRIKIWTPSFSPTPPLSEFFLEKAVTPLPPGLKFRQKTNPSLNETWIYDPSLHYTNIEELPVRNSGKYAASAFHYIATIQGLRLPQPVEDQIAKSNVRWFSTHRSLPLIELVAQTMEYSNNIFAELPVLMATKKLGVMPSSIQQSAQKMLIELKKMFSHLDWKGTQLINGSGLSDQNKINPITMSRFLYSVKDKQFNDRSFPSLLCVSGQTGSLRKRLNGPDTAYRVWAKTGSLFYVHNIAGYLYTQKGAALAFALFISDDQKRQTLGQPNNDEVNKIRQQSVRWNAQAQQVADRLLRYWIHH